MKKNIHPTYHDDSKIICECGNVVIAGSTMKEIKTEICGNCHPFYTGKQKLVDTAGRVEKFEAQRKKAQNISKPEMTEKEDNDSKEKGTEITMSDLKKMQENKKKEEEAAIIKAEKRAAGKKKPATKPTKKDEVKAEVKADEAPAEEPKEEAVAKKPAAKKKAPAKKTATKKPSKKTE